MSYQFAYLLADLMLCTLWAVLFLARKDLRKKMLLLSTVLGFLGPIGEFWFLRDYWRPEIWLGHAIGLEDYLFMFFMTGIACAIYQVIFNKRTAVVSAPAYKPVHSILCIVIGTVVIANILTFIFKLNSMYATIITMIIITTAILYLRKDLLLNSLVSGIMTGMVMVIGYVTILSVYPDLISRWWLLHNLSGVLIQGIPLEEIVWGFAFGAMIGPMYEFITGTHIA